MNSAGLYKMRECGNVGEECGIEYDVYKLVPWGTDGRLLLSGDFRSLIVE